MKKFFALTGLTGVLSILIMVDDAFAEGAAPSPAGGGLAGMLPLILVFVVFYFLVIRPQSKRHKDHENSIKSLKRGDKILTAGGIEGIIVKVDEENERLTVQIADGVDIKIIRNSAGVKEVISENNKLKKPSAQKGQKSSDGTKKAISSKKISSKKNSADKNSTDKEDKE